MSHIHIELNNVSFGYEPDKPVIKNVSLRAGEEESIGIIGANGAGKSTLLKLLVGLCPGFSGSIRVEEIPVERNTLPKIRERCGYVFQDSDSQLFMPSVYEDVAFAPRNYGLPEEEVERRTIAALERVNILHLKDKPVYRLSGGEKKLVSIATILSMTPDIILMDEPSTALDLKNRRNLINILNSFDHLKIIASHDLDMILETCKRTILLSDGRVVADGNTREILGNERLMAENDLELPLSMQSKGVI
ncbi:MAG: ABC transporter ATP-binding protein [Eubacteriales bacterium]|nr:ABC transporter ATP-binding protein [Eubacteriales bacterium]